jgi:hypothetical protein
MSSGASRRGEPSDIGSLMQRLKALEDTAVDFSIHDATDRAVPTTRAARGSPGLIPWFSLGFACSFLGGSAFALLASVIIHPAEAKPSFGSCTRTEPAAQAAKMPEARQLWWNVPCSIEGVGSRLARADE